VENKEIQKQWLDKEVECGSPTKRFRGAFFYQVYEKI
jgi:hypothetical protein